MLGSHHRKTYSTPVSVEYSFLLHCLCESVCGCHDSGEYSHPVSYMEGLCWMDLYYGKVLDDRWPLDLCWCVSERVDTEHPVLVILRPVLADAWITETLTVFASSSFPHEGQENFAWGNCCRILPRATKLVLFRLYNDSSIKQCRQFLLKSKGCGT